jgi:catechol 2,3-dioxygenase-like lactoylglutathione lyase family enzyme
MIRHIAAITEIVDDIEAAVSFYRDVLGLPVKYEQGWAYADVEVRGVLHFGIWLRKNAAKIIFGDPEAVDRIPLGFTIGFEADSVGEASQSIKARGYSIIQEPQIEPWGQKTSRLFSPSGMLCKISETPQARRIIQDILVQTET